MGVYEPDEGSRTGGERRTDAEHWTDAERTGESGDRVAGGIGRRGGGADDPTLLPDVEGDADTAELIAQIRALAAHDPMGVQQVVNEVLAALDRATHGAFRDQLSAGTQPAGTQTAGTQIGGTQPGDGFGEPSIRATGLETAAAEQRNDP